MNRQSNQVPLWGKIAIASSLLISIVLSTIATRGTRLQSAAYRSFETNFIAAPAEVTIEEIRQPVFVTNRFHWSQIESTNFVEFIDGLRRVGCPDRTVGDIIRAELRSVYEEREKVLRRQHDAARAEGKTVPLFQEQRIGLKREQELALEQLGVASDPLGQAMGDRLIGIAICHFFVGPLPEEKFNDVLRAMLRADAEEDLLRERERERQTNGVAAPKPGELFRSEVSRVLSPLEFEELAARSAVMRLLRSGPGPYTEVMDLTSYELRQIAVLRSKGESQVSLADFFDEAEPNAERDLQFTNAVATLLGPERARLFWIATDSGFQRFHEFTKEMKLPATTAVQLHGLHELAAAEGKRIQGESSGDGQSRAQKLKEIERQIQSSAREILGASAYEKFLHQGGQWLTNASNL